MIRLEIGSTSEVGQVREANEDSYLAADGLAVVADGMGGHRAGEVASAATVEILSAVEGNRSLDDMVRAVHRANRKISEQSAQDPDLLGMGTTVCVVGLVRRDDRDEVAVLNVGDSRVYLLAGGAMTQLTEDHSLVETLLQEGRITAEDAEDHPQKNVLTRALGVEPLVVVDAWLLEPREGDRLLLCSDGLTNEIDDNRISEILGAQDEPDVVSRRLVAEADAAGGRDNITAVVVEVAGSGTESAPVGDRCRRITTPAVDLSDEHGPHTETVLAVVATSDPAAAGSPGSDDSADPSDSSETDLPLATDPSASVDGDPEIAALAGGPSAGQGDPSSTEAESARANRWRTAAFALALFGIVALAVGAIAFTSKQGWYVSENDDGFLALYQGTPVLWIHPTEIEETDLLVADMTPSDRAVVREGSTFSSEAAAVRRLENFNTTTTSTTSTTSTAPTTTSQPPTTAAAPPGP